MEATFQDKQVPPSQDGERRVENAKRAEKGEPQVGGDAGRQQVASQDPSGECGKPDAHMREGCGELTTLFDCQFHRARQHHRRSGLDG